MYLATKIQTSALKSKKKNKEKLTSLTFLHYSALPRLFWNHGDGSHDLSLHFYHENRPHDSLE